jgi:hypothetical protein
MLVCKTSNRAGYTEVTFDDGYVNYYQYQDLQPCTTTTTSTTTTPNETGKTCQGDSDTWNAGWGLCHTYAPGETNNYWCDKDQGPNGLYAQDVCSECGVCTDSPVTTAAPVPTNDGGLPDCQGDDATWDAGWGNCPTYAEGESNHSWCDKDEKDGFLAEQVCSECGKCADSSAASKDTRRRPVFP